MGVSQGQDTSRTACSHAPPWEAERVIVPIVQTGILRRSKVNRPGVIQRASRWWSLDGNPDRTGGKVWIMPLQHKACAAEGYPQPQPFVPGSPLTKAAWSPSSLGVHTHTHQHASGEPGGLKPKDASGSGLRHSFCYGTVLVFTAHQAKTKKPVGRLGYHWWERKPKNTFIPLPILP